VDLSCLIQVQIDPSLSMLQHGELFEVLSFDCLLHQCDHDHVHLVVSVHQ
jgi:hypothetical protein